MRAFNLSLVSMLLLLASLLGCREHRHHPPVLFDGLVVFETSCDADTGAVAVVVLNMLNGDPVEDAMVWLGDDTAGAMSTDSSGRATFTGVSSIERMVSAGKPGWTLASIYVGACTVVLGIAPSDRTGVGAIGTITGTVDFGSSAAHHFEVFFLESNEAFYFNTGFSSDTVSPADPIYSVTAPEGDELVLVVAGYTIQNSLINFQAEKIDPDLVTQVDFQLGSDLGPGLFSSTSLLGLPQDHNQGSFAFDNRARIGGINGAAGVFPVNNGTGNTGNLFVPIDAITKQLQELGFDNLYSLRTWNTTTNAFSFELEPTTSSLQDVDYPDTQLQLSTTSTGPTPSFNIDSELTANNGFHTVRFESRLSNLRTRGWLFLLPGDLRSFTVPEVPLALADEGLVIGQLYQVEAVANIANISFDNGNFSATIDAESRVGYGDAESYLP